MIDFKPHDYQKDAFWKIVDAQPIRTFSGQQVFPAALFLDPGLGKTGITLLAIKALLRSKAIKGVLIVAPRRTMMSVWNPENPNADVNKFAQFNDLKVSLLAGQRKVHRQAKLEEDADIYVVNPEWLPQLRTLLLEEGIEPPFDMLVVDESTKFKKKPRPPKKSTAMSDKRPFVALWQMLHLFHRRVIMTGTPDPNGLMDLFGQIFLLDEGRTLGEFPSRFQKQFFWTPHPQSYKWFPREGSEEAVMSMISNFTLRMSAEDYLKLPELIYQDVQVDLPNDVAAIYREMERDFFTMLDNKEVIAVNEGSQLSKLHQISNGGMYVEQEESEFIAPLKSKLPAREMYRIHEAKNEALYFLLEEIQAPTLVFYFFKHDLERLKILLGDDVPNIGSGVSDKEIAQHEKHWNEGKLPVLLLNPASAAHGLNLQGSGDHVVWYSLVWDYELYEQAIRRVYRQGKERPVFVHHLIAHTNPQGKPKPTVDGVIRQALIDKSNSSAHRMKLLKDYKKSL